MKYLSKIIRTIRYIIIYRVLHADDTPHRLALGIALGLFVAWTPSLGFQMIIVLFLAALLGANGRIGILMVWFSNPLTLVPIYYPNYWLGRRVLSLFMERPHVNFHQAIKMSLFSPFEFMARFFQLSSWSELGKLLVKLSLDLWVGSVIVGLFLGVVFYIISYKFIVWHREHHPRRRG